MNFQIDQDQTETDLVASVNLVEFERQARLEAGSVFVSGVTRGHKARYRRRTHENRLSPLYTELHLGRGSPTYVNIERERERAYTNEDGGGGGPKEGEQTATL